MRGFKWSAAWVDAKLAKGEQPPWAWYQFMKLRETLDAILDGMAAVTPYGRILDAVFLFKRDR